MMAELPLLDRTLHPAERLPERILQFGEGNFLRGFADWMVHTMNQKIGYDTGIVLVQPRPGGYAWKFNDQEGLYTLYLTGKDGKKALRTKEIIDSIQRGINPYTDFPKLLEVARSRDLRIVISNTTEAGIYFEEADAFSEECPVSFPGKLARVLYERFGHFNGAKERGLVIMPTELIDNNGDYLKSIVIRYAQHWSLGEDFLQWLDTSCVFCNSLVDRIVPGLTQDKKEQAWSELGYRDVLMTEGEQFHLWAIEASDEVREAFPAPQAGLNVVFTDDLAPYRTRKVRVLNGAHTAMVPIGWFLGRRTVLESVDDPTLGPFLEQMIFEEILPTLAQGDFDEKAYARDILNRFQNPFIHHYLSDIALNTIPKFRARLLPVILYHAKAENPLPQRVVFALWSVVLFYRGESGGEPTPVRDQREYAEFIRGQWTARDSGVIDSATFVKNILGSKLLWEEDLYEIPGLYTLSNTYFDSISHFGLEESLHQFFSSPIKKHEA